MRRGVRQVKLVDRTFNYPDERARRIFAALIGMKQKYPQSRTNFHFEISASLLSDETLAVLADAPPGLIQFEVGIQSTHGDTLRAVGRGHSTQAVLEKTARLCRMKNLHVHIDLIAGLPLETPESFAQSLNDATGAGADRLQLGVLESAERLAAARWRSATASSIARRRALDGAADRTMPYRFAAGGARVATCWICCTTPRCGQTWKLLTLRQRRMTCLTGLRRSGAAGDTLSAAQPAVLWRSY